MDALYVKTPSGLQKVEIEGTGGGGSVSRKFFTSSNRSETLTAGTAFEVPTYTKGDNSLSVYIGGLLCSKGVEYNEVTAKTISFTSDVPAGFEITVVAYSSSESAGGAVAVQTDESRASVLKAGTAYAVPTHPLAENRLKVYLGGALSDGWTDVSETAISFNCDIPAMMPITVIAEV